MGITLLILCYVIVSVCLGGSEKNPNWTCLYKIYTTNTTVMNTCYYYLFVEPILPEYIDDGSIEPASFALIEKGSKVFRVSFFTTHNQLYMIRIEIPRVSDETIPESDLDIIQTISWTGVRPRDLKLVLRNRTLQQKWMQL